MQAVSHWELLANEVVKTQVLPNASIRDPSTGVLIAQPVYVDDSDRTEFGIAFHNYIDTSLINHGIQPVENPLGATVVKWGTQLVSHSKSGSDFPGIVGATLEAVSFALVGAPKPLARSNLEVIVITQVQREQTILSRQSRNYYVNSRNKMNFWQPPKKSS